MEKTKKKASKKKVSKRKKSSAGASGRALKPKAERPIGAVTHFFGGIKVAIVRFKKPVRIGAAIRIRGATTDFAQKIVSMQFDHEPVKTAKPGRQVGIKVAKRVREGDKIFEDTR